MEAWEKRAMKTARTGSRYICDPPVLDTDDDRVVLINGSFAKYAQFLLDEGFDVPLFDNKYYGSNNGRHPFFTARKGELNLIVMNSKEGFDYWVTATELAKKFNVKEKSDRVELFDAVCGNRYDRIMKP